MGQIKQPSESNAHLDSSFASERWRLRRLWQAVSFEAVQSQRASEAVLAMDLAVRRAEAARRIVQEQAVYVLLSEGLSVREIADQLGLSKSKVGRTVKNVMRYGHVVSLCPPDPHEKTRDLVLDAWQLPEATQWEQNPPQRAPDPAGLGKPTNFGGLNGD